MREYQTLLRWYRLASLKEVGNHANNRWQRDAFAVTKCYGTPEVCLKVCDPCWVAPCTGCNEETITSGVDELAEMAMKLTLSQKDKNGDDSLWMRCDACESIVYKKVVEEKQQVCPECGFHFRLSADQRVAYTLDEGSFTELYTNYESCDPLNFKAKKSYKEKYQRATKATGRLDAAIVGVGTIRDIPVTLCIIDANFIMGSMGSVVGEKIALAAEHALKNDLPLIIISGSGGGARMEEGLLSLFQMAKTSAALKRLQNAGGCYIGVLTNATMGGSMASWASLGDIILAEPQALLGFAGPRVIAQTVRQELPEGFQTSEFLLEHGFVDQIVERCQLKERLFQLLRYVRRDQPAFARRQRQTRAITRSINHSDTASLQADTSKVQS